MSERAEPFEPTWGRDEWPRVVEGGLDEGDLQLITAMLALSPLQRLQSLQNQVELMKARCVEDVRADSDPAVAR